MEYSMVLRLEPEQASESPGGLVNMDGWAPSLEFVKVQGGA